MGIYAIILFVIVFILILRGFPVAFTLGGVATLFALVMSFFYPDVISINDFKLLPSRIMGVIKNYVLMAVPLFVFMGVMLEKSGLAKSLLETMAILFGKYRGGLAISVIVVGSLLAASTGIVGATVVTMGLISLPTMVNRNYDKALASGTIAASGTLGQIIPPSIVLVLLADTLSSSGGKIDVGDLFGAALYPSLIMISLYIAYIIGVAFFQPEKCPAIPEEEIKQFKSSDFTQKLIKAFLFPLLLIVAVLGSILAGIASPTEAAAIGAMGSILLTIVQSKFSIKILKEACIQTTQITAMVFMILLGATTFTLVFRLLDGDTYLVSLLLASNLSGTAFLILVMISIFIIGFFIDFIEIIFIIIPVVTPIFVAYGMDITWIAVLIAINLQTSFLTPPFGFSLFYLKGVAPKEVKTSDIYKGVIPFIIIQIIFIIVLLNFPQLIS